MTVRRLPVKTGRLPGWLVNREYGRRKTSYPFKVKETLLAQKTVNITKNRQTIKAINAKQKSRYFDDGNRLIL